MFLDICTLFYASVIEMICFPSIFCTVRLSFWVFFQKPPGGLIPTARRLISDECVFLIWFESPGGDEFLPGGANWLCVVLMALMLNWSDVINRWVSNDCIRLCDELIGIYFLWEWFVNILGFCMGIVGRIGNELELWTVIIIILWSLDAGKVGAAREAISWEGGK